MIMHRVTRPFAALAICGLAAGSAGAVTTFTFGQATQIERGNTLRWARDPAPNPSGAYTLSSVEQNGAQPRYDFNFFFPDDTEYLFQTRMSLSVASGGAATTTASPGGTTFHQPLSGGIIQFTTLVPVTVGANTGTNVLTVAFTGGRLLGTVGGTSLTMEVSEPFDSIVYASDFMNFGNAGVDNFAFSMSSVRPATGVVGTGANARLRPFTASSTATFATTVVPEPATWAMLILGFGMVGVALRRRPVAA